MRNYYLTLLPMTPLLKIRQTKNGTSTIWMDGNTDIKTTTRIINVY